MKKCHISKSETATTGNRGGKRTDATPASVNVKSYSFNISQNNKYIKRYTTLPRTRNRQAVTQWHATTMF